MNRPARLQRPRAALALGLIVASAISLHAADPGATKFSQQQFGGLSRLTPLANPKGGEAVVHQANVGDRIVGWVFRTDQLEPFVKGRNGQVGTWVALGIDGRIKAIDIAQHREDKPWFVRLKRPFYKQFEGLAANGSDARPDTVATATLSSKAIVDDVLGACAEVLKLPAVSAALQAQPATPPAITPVLPTVEPRGAPPRPVIRRKPEAEAPAK